MRRLAIAAGLCALAALPLQAQSPDGTASPVNNVDVVLTNISGVNGAHKDSLGLVGNNVAGGYRVLAQEVSGATGSTGSRPFLVDVNGVSYLYWFDNIVDDVVRARDANGNGVLDPTEFEIAWDMDTVLGVSATSPDGWSWNPIARRGLVPNDFNMQGVYELIDGDGDGLFTSPGEWTQVFDGSVGTAVGQGGLTYSVDDVETAHQVGNGIVVFYEDDDRMLTRYDRNTGEFAPFFNYSNAGFPINDDVSVGRIPPANNDLDRIAVDYSTTPETIYAGVNFTTSSPYVYALRDLNGDGDAQDPGEARLFIDGTLTSSPIVAIDDIAWYNGALYVSHETASSGSNPGEFFEFFDANGDLDAMDAGEQTLIGSLPASNDPSILGINVVPSGFFGSSCVEANIETGGLTSAGGILDFTFTDIPAARQGGTELGLVGISATPGGNTPLAPGCNLGLTVDPLTLILLTNFQPSFTTMPITSGTASTLGFTVPPGVTGKIYYAGVFIGGAPGATQTKCLDIQ